MPTNVVLVSIYELGHQSFGVASAAAALRRAGATVTMQDLSIAALDTRTMGDVTLVGVSVPMHTATRLAEPVIRKIKSEYPDIHLCVFGLYGAMNERHLRDLGADSVLSGETEQGLVEVFCAVANGRATTSQPTISLKRLALTIPDRSGLPQLDSYAHMQMPDGVELVVGYTEATRGCKHLCRHCPIVPVYQGRFFVVDADVVLADIRQQVEAGAQHITFGDPDFFNGPAHAMRIVRRMHDQFPDVSYDVTIKVEHLVQHDGLLAELVATGCNLVTTAVESFDETVLERFDKRHTMRDFEHVLATMRDVGLAINPTFVTFTPWTTVDDYIVFLETVARHGLVQHVSPIQYAIRLLVPAGSKLLELPEMSDIVGPFDRHLLYHPWTHRDPSVDALFQRVTEVAMKSRTGATSRSETFHEVWNVAHEVRNGSEPTPAPPDLGVLPVAAIPYLTEPWYC